MSKRFRLTLIGAGQIGAQSHLPAVLACEEVELAAIVDPAPGRAARLARSYRVSAPTFTDLGPALELADGAIIATPNDTHYAVARRCLERGIHVLIEKPMTSTYAEASALVDLVDATGLVAMVGYGTRHEANVKLLKRLLDQQHFGAVASFAYQFGSNGGWAPLSGYRAGHNGVGGGVLAVTGSHFLDRMLWFWGYPAELEYFDDGIRGPEANCLARFRYEGGMTGTLRCSKTAVLPGGLVLETDRGQVLLTERATVDLILIPNDNPGLQYSIGARGRESHSGPDPFVTQIADFAAACRTGAGSGCNARQGAASVKLLEDLYSRKRPLAQDWYAPVGSDVAA
jgi:predicted dehydrogenase